MADKVNKKKDVCKQSERLTVTPFEREILLKACEKYRYTIPAYIQSRQSEADALEALIKKLS